jgi:outer membrane protein
MYTLKYILFTFVLTFSLLYSKNGTAEDLLAVYQLAEMNDPVIQAAKGAQLAAREVVPQARAQFMPVISASANHTATDINYNAPSTTDSTQLFPPDLHYNQSVYGLSLTQPIFYYQQWVQLAKASEQVKQANATYAAAEQELIVRTIQYYFGVLKAFDALKFAKAAREAYAKFTEQTEQRFKVGLTTDTDVQIAKAQRDSAYAREITAANNLEDKKEQLRTITGKKIEHYTFLREKLALKKPDPANIEQWVAQAVEQNFTLLAAKFRAQAARTDIKLNSANHLPTLSIGAGVTHSTSMPITPRNTNRNVGLQVQLPLFNGGAITSKTRQSVHTYEQIYQQMEALHRQTESNTRQAYLGVLSQISQVSALKQAVVSNQSALTATEEAFKVGSRTIVDVLTYQSNLIQAEQDYAFARYDYILQSIQLKQAAGILNPEDVRHINAWLQNKSVNIP